MQSRVVSQVPKVQTPVTSSFGVKPHTIQTVKERNNQAPDSKFNLDLNSIAVSRPNTSPESPKVNFKHNLQLAQRNPLREARRPENKENQTQTLNLKSFNASSSPIPPPTKRVSSSIISKQRIKDSYRRSPYFNSSKQITVNRKPISVPSGNLKNPQIQRNTRANSHKVPSFSIKNYNATPNIQKFPTSIAEAKQAILGKIAGWAQDIPGYYLLRVILGKDPISEESVPRTSANIIRGVISLIPGGERLYQQMNQTGAIDRAGAWLDKNLAKLNLTWATISSLIGKAWDSLSIWDFRSPSKVFGKIKKVFSPLVSRIVNFAKSAGNQLLEFILEGALKLAGPLATKVMGILKGAGQLFTNIIKDPIKFVNNLVKGLKQGFQGFVGNIWTHIKKGLIVWLTGALGGANIELPDDIFSLSGAFSLATQVLGLTFGYIRRKAVKMFGEKVVSAMEKGVSLFQTLQSGGVNALWDLVQDKMSDLKSMVIAQIKDTVVGQVIQAGIKWIIGLLNPAGALLKAGMAIYEIIVFFVNRASQIAELVQAVMQAVKAISQGAVGGAAKLVENALAKALPVAISFLASLLGINGLAKKVQNIIKRVRKKIDGAIDKLLKKARKAVKKLVKGKKGKGKNEKFTQKDKTAGLAAFEKEEKPFVKNGAITQANARKVGTIVKNKHPVFKSISVIDGKDSWNYKYIFRAKDEVDTSSKKRKVDTEEWIEAAHPELKGHLRKALQDKSPQNHEEFKTEALKNQHINKVWNKPLQKAYNKTGHKKAIGLYQRKAKELASPIQGDIEKSLATIKTNLYKGIYGSQVLEALRGQMFEYSKSMSDVEKALKEVFETVITRGGSSTQSADDVFKAQSKEIQEKVKAEVRKDASSAKANAPEEHDWVAVFPAKGRKLYAKKDKKNIEATLGGLRNITEAALTTRIAKALKTTISRTDSQAEESNQEINKVAQKIASNLVKTKLLFINHTDIPRYLKAAETSEFIKTNNHPISPHLYSKVPQKHKDKIEFKYGEEVHHVVPLYLGGSHHLSNLLKVQGKAKGEVSDSVHRELHDLIDEGAVTTYIQDKAGQPISVTLNSLKPSELKSKITPQGLNIVIGTLFTDSSIKYRDTKIALKK